MQYSLTEHHPVSFWVLCTALVLVAEASFVYLAMQPKVTTYQQPGLSLQADTKIETETNEITETQKILPSKLYKNTQKAETQPAIDPLPANCFATGFCIPVSGEPAMPTTNKASSNGSTSETNTGANAGDTPSQLIPSPIISTPLIDISL